MDDTIIIYRRTATASTYFMAAFGGVYATTPVSSIDLSKRCFNTEYECVVRYLLDNRPGPLLIVNLVRNPYTRFLSQFFKNLDQEQIKEPTAGEWIRNPFNVGGDYSFENMARVFKRSMHEFLIPHDYGIERSYTRLFGIDLGDHDFDYERHCVYFEHDRFRFITLRQEDSSEWSRVFREVLGIKVRFGWTRVNRGRAPGYGDFKKRFAFSDEERKEIEQLETYQRYYQDHRR